MLKFNSILFFFCLSFFSLASQASYANKILVLGDSISAGYGFEAEKGWVNLLAKRLTESNYNYEVINGSVSGNTSGDGLGRLPALLGEFKPKIVIIQLGGNDGLRGHPIKLIRKNLQRLIDTSRESGAKVLLSGIEIPPNYGQRYTDSFRNNYVLLAEKNALAFAPFLLEDIAINKTLMQDDGIHPTVEAQPKMLTYVWPYLKPLL